MCTCLPQGKKHCLKIPKGDFGLRSLFCFPSILLWRPVLNIVWPDSSIWKKYGVISLLKWSFSPNVSINFIHLLGKSSLFYGCHLFFAGSSYGILQLFSSTLVLRSLRLAAHPKSPHASEGHPSCCRKITDWGLPKRKCVDGEDLSVLRSRKTRWSSLSLSQPLRRHRPEGVGWLNLKGPGWVRVSACFLNHNMFFPGFLFY